MKKLLALGICIGLGFSTTLTNAQYVSTTKKNSFPQESYKTVKPVKVQYSISYSNDSEADYDPEVEPSADKYGLFQTDSIILLNKPSKSFPSKYIRIHDDLIDLLKLNRANLVKKVKSGPKGKSYMCEIKGQMNAQFTVEYDGRNEMRFPNAVSGEIKSANLIGSPKIECFILEDHPQEY